MLHLDNWNKCFGCTACHNACPFDAIKMKTDKEGFIYPWVDEGKCTNCDLCNKVCPAQKCFKISTTEAPKTFASQAKDEIRKNSSSGGVFSTLAQQIIEDDGYVCGSAFDNDWKVKHIIINSMDDLPKLRGSKYVQSDNNDVYSEIKVLLDKNKSVLYSGTPCQVAGLYGYLRKDYDNLLTVDLLCHGVPSPKVFERYIEEQAKGEKIEAINFRDKTYGWRNYHFKIETDKNTYTKSPREDVFMRGFIASLYLRPCCESCPFTSTIRASDITIGDYWGINKYSKRLNDNKGLSVILINTPKGEKYFDKTKNNLILNKETPLKFAVGGNRALSKPSMFHANRAEFFKRFQETDDVTKLIEQNLTNKNVGIMNYQHSENNYGALMVGYSLAHAVKKLGYSPIHIDYMPPRVPEAPKNFKDFKNRFIQRTKTCKSEMGLRKRTVDISKLIVGSDQVWRWHHKHKYNLRWADGFKTLISYAASFGHDFLEESKSEAKKMSKYLKRFDAISVREESGVDICKNQLDVDAVSVLDPTLLLNKEDYMPIIDAEKLEPLEEDYVAYMFLDKRDEAEINKPENLADMKAKYKFINVMKDENGNQRTFGNWLNHIKCAKYFVTGSFHGSVFASIFGRDFVTITSHARGNARIFNLFKKLGVDKSRIYENMPEISEASFSPKIDYGKVYENLDKERTYSLEFLKKALAIEPNKKKSYKYDIIFETIKNFFYRVKISKGKMTICIFSIPIIKMKHKN